MSVRIGVPGHGSGAGVVFRSEFVWDRAELRRAARAAVRCRLSLPWRLALTGFGLMLCLVCILAWVLLLSGPSSEFTVMFLAMYGIFLAVGLALSFHGVLFVWVNCRGEELRSRLGSRVLSVVTAAGIRSPSLGTEDVVSWKAFRRIGVGRHGVLLVMADGVFHWLPQGSFGDVSDWEAVCGLARRHMR